MSLVSLAKVQKPSPEPRKRSEVSLEGQFFETQLSHRDFDECESGDACCAQLCINYSGGYECGCQEGFQISLDGCGCDDVDECLDVSVDCGQLCINSVGTYDCACEEGYRIGSDGRTCLSLDDEQFEEEEEVLDILRFPGLLVQSSPQPLPYYAPSLTASYEDENNDEEDQEAEGEFQGLTALQRVGGCDGQDAPSTLTFPDLLTACSTDAKRRECRGICNCQNGGTCDPHTGQCQCPPGVYGKICEEGCLKGFFGKDCKRKCHCAKDGHCHRVYGACICDLGRYGRFCHLSCPRGTYGAGCSLECQCVEENTLDCSAKNGSCTCKSGYQGNRCQEGTIQ
ncbi:EGF-like domain-containing protein C3orf50-like [Cricetulus griseus]|uniref:EGF-like domain-containing protein C3orf50-like n=1 Tax=Cricetulus griseus TaxID=10029 RepID=G3HVY2_CRIGR|nr:EGF-like domain-containing protein C3orf50-like [Cricetulus griseus]